MSRLRDSQTTSRRLHNLPPSFMRRGLVLAAQLNVLQRIAGNKQKIRCRLCSHGSIFPVSLKTSAVTDVVWLITLKFESMLVRTNELLSLPYDAACHAGRN